MTDEPIRCERCLAAEARVALTRVRDGVKTREFYCVGCAEALGAATVTVPAAAPREPKA